MHEVAAATRGSRARRARREPRRSPMRASTRTADSSADASSEHVGEEVVEPAAVRRRARPDASQPRSRAASSASSRSVASLSTGWRSTVAPAASAAASAVGSTESRSPTTTSTRASERDRMVQPRVGGDDERGVGQAVERVRAAGDPRLRTRAPCAGLQLPHRRAPIGPSAGITRFRFEGSATRDGRPLSPADPSSPGILMSPASTAAQLSVQARSRIHRTRADCGDGSRNRDRAGASRRDGVEQRRGGTRRSPTSRSPPTVVSRRASSRRGSKASTSTWCSRARAGAHARRASSRASRHTPR